MNNLLLNEDKKRVIREYLTRLFVVFLFLLAFLGGIFFLSLLPSDISSWSKEKAIQSQKQAVDQAVFSLESENLNFLISDVKEKVESLKKGSSGLPLHVVLEKILAHKNSGIVITGFIFQPEKTKNRQVSVEGIANSRDNLVKFSKSLEEEEVFAVSLPVSNFAKQGNIDFMLDILIHID